MLVNPTMHIADTRESHVVIARTIYINANYSHNRTHRSDSYSHGLTELIFFNKMFRNGSLSLVRGNKRITKCVLIRVHRSMTALADRGRECGGRHASPALQEFSLLG